jgi:hypothetical protein
MRCIPSEYRAKGGGEWNHYKVTANDGVIKLEVNGKEVSGVSKCNPRKGYLALESEGAECHFKNIRIKELPSTNPKPEEVAKEWEGHTSIFNGLDLKGWKTEKDGWKVGGGILKADVKGRPLVTEKTFGNAELVFDWRVPAKTKNPECTVLVGGEVFIRKLAANAKPGSWQRETVKYDKAPANTTVGPIEIIQGEGLEIMNVFARELKEKK